MSSQFLSTETYGGLYHNLNLIQSTTLKMHNQIGYLRRKTMKKHPKKNDDSRNARRKWKKKERKNLESSFELSFDPINYEEFIPKVDLNTANDPLDYNPVSETENTPDISVVDFDDVNIQEDDLDSTENHSLSFGNFIQMVDSLSSFVDEFDLSIEDVLMNYPFELTDGTPPLHSYYAAMSDSNDESDDEMSVDSLSSADSQTELLTQENIVHGDQCPGLFKCHDCYISDSEDWITEGYTDEEIEALALELSPLAVKSTRLVHFGSSAEQLNCIIYLMAKHSVDFESASELMKLNSQEDDQLFQSYSILSAHMAKELDIPCFSLEGNINSQFLKMRFGILYDDEYSPHT